MKTGIYYYALVAITVLATSSCSQQKDSWTHFRGNDLDGIAAPGDYPVTWNDSTNIDWKVAVKGRGWSSPVVMNNQVWLTSATPDGRHMFADCYDISSGESVHHVDLFHPEKVYGKHSINSYATPTSAIEEGYVYVHFGRYGTACIDTGTGDLVWKRSDMQCEHIQGPGSSLFLYGNKLIVHMEGTDVQEIYALDKRTGETIWKAERDPEFLEPLLEIGKKAYVTPIVIEVNSRKLLISNGSASCSAYDLETGEEVWYIPQGEDSTISMPVEYGGKVYFFTSFVTPEEGEKYCELLAADPDGTGDISDQVIWRKKFPILQLLTPVIYEGLLYTIDTKGVLYCLDAANGETIWTRKLKGKYNSSPVVAGGNVYVNSIRGETLVFRAGRSFELVAENSLKGEIWATPAFVNGDILMRTSKGLFKIEI
ncbi:MAG: PQQ-like beta-propeller repeat protein [Bacteroidales bacterium]|nr:PQQ-like beta-propeller repeat protein [Bacteroidales bacterium]